MTAAEPMRSRLQVKLAFVCAVIGAGVILLGPFPCRAAIIEQMAIGARAMSLANTMTAYPGAITCIHYNPAGLNHMPEGKILSHGNVFVYIDYKAKFEEDPEFEGFFGNWGPGHPKRDNPHALDQSDPVAGTESKVAGALVYMPVIGEAYGPIKLPITPAPAVGITYRAPGSRWTYGYGIYAPFGGGMYREKYDTGKFYVKGVYIQHLVYAGVATSCQVTDSLSLGLTVSGGQTAQGVEQYQRTPNEIMALTRVLGDATKDLNIPPISQLTLPPPWFGGGISPYDTTGRMELSARDDFTPAYNLGLLWEPTDWFAFGAVYQSAIKAQMKGNFKLSYSEEMQKMIDWQGSSPLLLIVSGMLDLPYKPRPYQSGMLRTDMEFPQRFQFGVMFRPFKKLKLMFDVHWANWSVWKNSRITLDQDLDLLKLAKLLGYTYGDRDLVLMHNHTDSWHWSAGLEFRLNEKVALRCGYEHRKRSTVHEWYSMLAPMPTLSNFGVGVEISNPDGYKVELCAAFITDFGYSVPDNTSRMLNSTTFTDVVYNPYAGLDYKQNFNVYAIGIQETIAF
jgi:long-subunit fatty acid transport protein